MSDRPERPASPGIGRQRQQEVYVAGVGGRTPRVPVDPAQLETAAVEMMSEEATAYIVGGAGMGSGMVNNRSALDRWRIVPRVLRGAARRDLSVELFGRSYAYPLLLAPIGVLEMAHRKADLAVARAAAALGVPMIFSSQASVPMERCAEAMGEGPRWFQLYWSESDTLTKSFVSRAESCGCDAVVLTLDTTLLGWRPQDLDLAYLPFLHAMGIAQYTSDPSFLAALDELGGGGGGEAPAVGGEPAAAPKPPLRPATIATALDQIKNFPGGLRKKLLSGQPRAAVERFVRTYSRPALAWDDLERLRSWTNLPIVLKGILHPDDAALAIEHGASGIVVSNHGGRQIDGVVATAEALPAIAEAVDGRIPILFDSGIRGGADIFRALALGADAVLLGRPYVYGLALAGEAGVREVVRNVAAELDLTMGLAGCASLGEVDRSMLAEASG